MSCWSLGPVVSSTQACKGIVHLGADCYLLYLDSALSNLYLAHFGLEIGIALISISPIQETLDLIREFFVILRMGALKSKTTQRAEMTLDSIHPRGVGGGEDQLGIVLRGPRSYVQTFVRGKVVHHEVKMNLPGVEFANVGKELQKLLATLSSVNGAAQHVGVDVVEGQHVANTLGAVIRGRKACDLFACCPRLAVIRTALQRSELM